MKLMEEYFPQFVEAMDDVDTSYEMRRPFDDKIFHLICFALAAKDRNPTSLKAHFHAAVSCGASTKEMAYVIAMVERESARMADTWIHEALGDWVQLTKDDYDSGCGCGIARRY